MAEKMAVKALRYHRNRLAGDVRQLEEANAGAHERIERINRGIEKRTEKISQLKSSVAVLGVTANTVFSMEIGPPVPRKTCPKRHLTTWGGIKRAALQILKEAAGAPVTSADVVQSITASNQLVLSGKDRKRLLKSVSNVFGKLVESGIATRVHTRTIAGERSSWALSASIA